MSDGKSNPRAKRHRTGDGGKEAEDPSLQNMPPPPPRKPRQSGRGGRGSQKKGGSPAPSSSPNRSAGPAKRAAQRAAQGEKKKAQKASGKKAPTIENIVEELSKENQAWWVSATLPIWIVWTIQAMDVLNGFVKLFLNCIMPGHPMEDVIRTDFHDSVQGFSAFDRFLIWSTANGTSKKVAKETIRLAQSFATQEEFMSAVVEACHENSYEYSLDLDSVLNCLAVLAESPNAVKRGVRVKADQLKVKLLKVPPEVVDLDKDLAQISNAIKIAAMEKQRRVDEIKKQYDEAKKDLMAFNAEVAPIKDMMKEYYAVKSGSLNRKEREHLITRYQSSEDLKSRYTQEQFMTIVSRRNGAANAARRVQEVRSNDAFAQGIELIRAISGGHQNDDYAMDDEGDEDQEADVGHLDALVEGV